MTSRWYTNSATLVSWYFLDADTMVNKFHNFTITYPWWPDDDIKNSATLVSWHFLDDHTMVKKIHNFSILYPWWSDDDIEIPQI